MATLPIQVVPHSGLEATYSPASAGGDQAGTGAGVLLHVKNGDSAQHTVTLAVPEKVDSLAVDSREVTVAAGTDQFIPLPSLYEDPATGLASISYDAVTSVTVAVFRSS